MPRVAKSSNASVEKFGGSDPQVFMVNAPATASLAWPNDASTDAAATIAKQARRRLRIPSRSGTRFFIPVE
jgi:hypothetical protein